MSHDSEQIHTLRVLLHVTQYPQYSTISLDSDILHIFYSFSIYAIPSTNPANARRLSPHTTNITYLSNVPLTRHQCLYVLLHLDLPYVLLPTLSHMPYYPTLHYGLQQHSSVYFHLSFIPAPAHIPHYPFHLPIYGLLIHTPLICPTTHPFRMSFYLCNFPYALLSHPSITSQHIHILLHMSYYPYSLIWQTIPNLPYLEGDLDINTRYNYLRIFGIICTITVLHKLI